MPPKNRYINFNDIEVSTMTIIGITNWSLNIEKLFDNLNVIDYVVVPKKRGRKKKEHKEDPNQNIQDGDIITLKYIDKIKGVNLKNKKNKNTQSNDKKNYFRNSITVVMFIDGKFINFKISQNGKFQITGCKRMTQAEKCITHIWQHIKHNDVICKIQKNTNPEAIFLTMMTNIDFNIGFNVNREALDTYINTKTDYKSILETSFGYTGVNIKTPLIPQKGHPDINKITLIDDTWINSKINHQEYFNSLSKKDQKKELTKERFNTFLVFHSGNVILSSKHYYYMKDVYEQFIQIITNCRHIIEEKVLD